MNGKITFGINLIDKKPLSVNLAELINPHILIVGVSGSGKSYNIKKLLESIAKNYPIKRIYNIDGQGDLATPNTSSVVFTESGNVGINPLKLSSDPVFGGVRKKVQQFINAINKTSRQLGNRQEAVLRNLLKDLYMANGFFEDDPSTWKLEEDGYYRRKYPDAQDLLRFTYSKLVSKKFGLTRESVKYFHELEKLNKKKSKLIKEKIRLEHQKRQNYENEEYIKNEMKIIDKQIEEVKEKIKTAFLSALEKANGAEEKDIIKYENVETLKSVYDVLENLFSVGFFKSKEPKFDFEKKIWRYDISSLNIDEQKLFAEFVGSDLFNKARETGLKDRVYEYLVIDEAKKFTDLKKDKDDILKLVAREARKYGLGQILATQQIEHIPEDIIQNSGITLVLGVHESKADLISKKLNVKKDYLLKIKPHKTALISIKTRNSSNDFYYPIIIDIK